MEIRIKFTRVDNECDCVLDERIIIVSRIIEKQLSFRRALIGPSTIGKLMIMMIQMHVELMR